MGVKFRFDNFLRDFSLPSEKEFDRLMSLVTSARREILEGFYGQSFVRGLSTATVESRNLVCEACSEGNGEWCSDCADVGESLPVVYAQIRPLCFPELQLLFKDGDVLFAPELHSSFERFEDHVKDSAFFVKELSSTTVADYLESFSKKAKVHAKYYFWPEEEGFEHPGEGFTVEIVGLVEAKKGRKLSKVEVGCGTGRLPIKVTREKRREAMRRDICVFSERAVEHFEKKGLKPKKREKKPLRLKEVQLAVPFYYMSDLEILFEKARRAFSSPSLINLCRELKSQPQLAVSPGREKQKEIILGRFEDVLERKDVAEASLVDLFKEFRLDPSKKRNVKKAL